MQDVEMQAEIVHELHHDVGTILVHADRHYPEVGAPEPLIELFH